MRKPKLLMCTEFSQLSTGYSVYSHLLLSHLNKTNKYELAEMSCYCSQNDPRRSLVPWKTYPTLPQEGNQDEINQYNAIPEAQFGLNKFESICLDFQPDVVFDIRDHWMFSYQGSSPYRRLYNWAICPTVDSYPQNVDWISSFIEADSIFTYTDFSNEVLRNEGGSKINLQPVSVPAGVDLEIFQPVKNKSEHKRMFGMKDDTLIVGCFAENTQVLMSDLSYKNIQDVQINDFVIDAEGNEQKVENTYKFTNNKQMVSIDVVGEPENIVLTEDHEILSVVKESEWYKPNPGTKYFSKYYEKFWTPSFNEPKNLKKGDYWVFKIPDKIIDVDYIELENYVENSINGKKINNNISIDENFMWLSGLYLGDGHIASSKDCENHSVVFSINQKDKFLVDKIIYISQTIFNVTPTVEELKNTKVSRVSINNVYVGRLFAQMFGRLTENKTIPDFMKKLPPNKQLFLVRGWQSADGCDAKDGRNIGISINFGLASIMRLFLLRNNIVCSLNKPNMELQNCFKNAKQQWKIVERISNKHQMQFIYNGYLYCRINNIELVESPKYVYDLTVSNSHSYVVYCKGVHNTVQRNQKRKLYPDLFEAFAQFLKESPSLANRTYLYCHTAFPDLGFDLPYFLKKFGIANKVLFTYCCFKCGAVFPSIYQDVRTVCPRCKDQNVTFPNTQRGIDRNSLAAIMGLFDVYIQYSIAEAQALPIAEAAACGVPVMVVDYSGQADVCKKVNGYPIKVQRMFYESETNCQRALPDNSDLVNKLTNFLQLPESMRLKKGFEARKGAEKHYNWDTICKRWEDYFDSVEIKPIEKTWKSPPRIISTPQQIPNEQQLNDEQFVNWALVNILGQPEKIGSYFSLKLCRDLMWKATNMDLQSYVFNDFSLLGSRPTIVPFDRNALVAMLSRLAQKNNHWEQIRWQKVLSGEIK